MNNAYIILLINLFCLVFCGDINIEKKADGSVFSNSKIEYTNRVINEDNKYYNFDLRYPFFSGDDAQFINSEIKDYLNEIKEPYNQKNIAEIKAVVNASDSNSKYEETLFYQVYQSGSLLSVVFENNSYTLGAHGNTSYYSININLDKSKRFNIVDYFNQLKLNRVKINKEIPQYFVNTDSCFSMLPTIDSNSVFSVQDDSLYVFYAPYELGAYACGTYSLVLPLNKLK